MNTAANFWCNLKKNRKNYPPTKKILATTLAICRKIWKLDTSFYFPVSPWPHGRSCLAPRLVVVVSIKIFNYAFSLIFLLPDVDTMDTPLPPVIVTYYSIYCTQHPCWVLSVILWKWKKLHSRKYFLIILENNTFSRTFSNDAGATTEKQIKKTSVCGYESGLSLS